MPPSSVRTFAKRIGVTIMKSKKKTIWTEEDTAVLTNLVNQGKTLIEIAGIMNKKDNLISKKARELRLNIVNAEKRTWSKEESNELIECAKTMNMDELVKKFNRTSASINTQAKKFNITIIKSKYQWTNEECELLRKLVLEDRKSPKEIAGILGRSEDAIIVKMGKLGLRAKGGKKRYWTKEEEELLTDLWGTMSIESVAKKLDRTPSSIMNKVYLLKLGSVSENNYEGLKIQEICDLFNVNRTIVEIFWITLGLKCKTRKISEKTSYKYVEIKDLFQFLEANQNIWDSRNLEVDILGKEPNWLKEKRKRDINKPEIIRLELMKQQLIIAGKYYLKDENIEEQGFQKIIKKDDNNG